jgi:hypothetical protein
MNCKNNGFSGSAFHKLFWIAANAYNEYVFGKAMEKISEYNANATAYLNSCIEQWSRHKFDSTVCCDHNTTNFVESFNACTKPFRDMPVFSLLEGITLLIIFMHNITPELVVCCLMSGVQQSEVGVCRGWGLDLTRQLTWRKVSSLHMH